MIITPGILCQEKERLQSVWDLYFERMFSTVLTTSQTTLQYETEPQTEMGQCCVPLTGTA